MKALVRGKNIIDFDGAYDILYNRRYDISLLKYV